MQEQREKLQWVLQVVVSMRSLLQDRMAALNGRTVEYVLKQDKQAFIRLIGLSVAQVCVLPVHQIIVHLPDGMVHQNRVVYPHWLFLHTRNYGRWHRAAARTSQA